MSIVVGSAPRAPETGQLVVVRDRRWVVAEVTASNQPADFLARSTRPQGHRLSLRSVEDDGRGESLDVIWEVEPGARVVEAERLPSPEGGRFDDPATLDAFLDAVRWGAIASADQRALQSPFRSGITIEEYQLDPVVRALRMPRVNLLVADDVGVGKTVEAGLVIQELLLRHRARTILVVCPAPLQVKWQQEMAEKFGLEFRILDSDTVREIRRTRGVRTNPFSHYPRLITSIDWLKRPEQMAKIRDLLPTEATAYPRRFDLLVIDEVHMCAPSGSGRYATDSQRTQCVRELAPHFEHRVFLSATPHNGYSESFTALLELLDPQRFARGVEPSPEALSYAVVRRLKSELREAYQAEPAGDPCDPATELGEVRFPFRCVQELEVEYPDDERRAHSLLRRYAELRRKQAGAAGHRAGEAAADFVTLLLKKRLFSSPAAFANTLGVHLQTLAARATRDADTGTALRNVQAAFDRLDEDVADERELDRATQDALAAAAAAGTAVTDEQQEILRELSAWSERARTRPDAKTERLLELVRETCRPGGGWNDQRIILFTEFRDTQIYLANLLHQHGLAGSGGDRLALIYGGMDGEERERVRMQFQAHPSRTPVRILLATDAASEGIDLQKQCHRLVHVEVPFSPTKMEQRNGRVDRHLQPSPRVLIYHFVGKGWETAPAGSAEADLGFLFRIARKVDKIRDDLGSVGPVLAEQIERHMLFGTGSMDAALANNEVRTRRLRRLNRIERDLRERLDSLAKELFASRQTLGISPESVRRVVEVGLALSRQPELEPREVEFTSGARARVYMVPPLAGSWKRATADLPDPLTGAPRPITFDHEVARGNDDVVLAHIGHPLVARSLRLLRAEIWSSHPTLSRVSAREADVPDLTVIAHARLVVTGGDAHRLHEEVVRAGGVLRDGRFRRIDTIRELDELQGKATDRAVGEAAHRQVERLWPEIQAGLERAVQARSQERAESLANTLARQRDADIDAVTRILTELQTSITARLREVEHEEDQLTLGLDVAERDQWRRDVDALKRRLERIPEEIVRETEAMRRRYSDPVPRPFPAAVTVLVPRALAQGRIL
ncbi:MAG TPA: DISARM system SNF2-like helicase DrmD [Longimicrobium sp.]